MGQKRKRVGPRGGKEVDWGPEAARLNRGKGKPAAAACRAPGELEVEEGGEDLFAKP